MKSLSHLVLLAVLAPAAYSQSILFTFDGDSTGDYLGFSVSGAGDVNGDGFDDLIVGVPGEDNNGLDSGSALVISGLDGSVLHTFDGDSADDFFGYSVSGAGDVNGDGYDDVIVGAHFDDNNGPDSGMARVFSGVNGSILYTFDGDSAGDVFGYSVSDAGDVNGDGYADLIVGAISDDENGSYSGSARVFSGVDGSILHTFYGNSAGDWLGNSVSGAGDVNGDGLDDLIVGVPHYLAKNRGRALVFSGLDGSTLYSFVGDSKYDSFGFSVSGAGDVNGDGLADLVVGARDDDNNGKNSGSALVFSGLDGSILHHFDGDSSNDIFGYSVSGAGDVNGDGLADLIVAAPWGDGNEGLSGNARIFSGRYGSVLYTVDGDSLEDFFGWSVSGAGDVNGDGYDDLIVGAYGDDNNGSYSGSVRVFSGCDLCGPIGQSYCGPANFNSTGQSAVIAATGRTTVLDNTVRLTASQLPLNVFGYFLNSDVQGFTPFPPGSNGNLCLGGGIGRHAKQIGNTGAAGELIIYLDLTALPRPGGTHSVVAGETWNFQAWFRDNVGGPTSNFTEGIEIVFN